MDAGLWQSSSLTLTLFWARSWHSGAWAGLSWQAGLHTGREHLEQGSRGGFTGARQEGQTGEVTSPGPFTPATSVRMVSRARIFLEATRPRPAPSMFATLKGKHLVLGR